MDLRRLVKVSWGRGLLFFDGVWGIGLQACRQAHSVVGSIFMCVCPAGGQRRPPAFLHAAAVNIPSVPGFRLMNKGRKATADPSTHHPPPPPQRRRPVAGDPGTEVRLGPLSLRMTVHFFCNSLKESRLLGMNRPEKQMQTSRLPTPHAHPDKPPGSSVHPAASTAAPRE